MYAQLHPLILDLEKLIHALISNSLNTAMLVFQAYLKKPLHNSSVFKTLLPVEV